MILRTPRWPVAAVVATSALLGMSGVTALAASAAGNGTTICHRTHATNNPYRRITVSQSAINGSSANDHTHHTGPLFRPGYNYPPNEKIWGDIIPDRTAGGAGAGLNWSAEGQAMLAGSRCGVLSAQAFYNLEREAGVPRDEILADLQEQGASEDAAISVAELSYTGNDPAVTAEEDGATASPSPTSPPETAEPSTSTTEPPTSEPSTSTTEPPTSEPSTSTTAPPTSEPTGTTEPPAETPEPSATSTEPASPTTDPTVEPTAEPTTEPTPTESTPTEPSTDIATTEPTSTEPSEPTDPTDQTEPTEPTEPIEPTEPTRSEEEPSATQHITGRVWLDLDRDGTQDAGEPGLPQMSVQLTAAAATQEAQQRPGTALLRAGRPFLRGVAEQSTLTNASGDYGFWALVAADYRVAVKRPAPLDVTWDSTGPADAIGEVELAVGGEGTVDVGLVGDSGVQATVVDADGAPADGEAALRWVGVDDTFSTDDDVLVHSRVTSGQLRLNGLPAGRYRIDSVGATTSTQRLNLDAGSILQAEVQLAGDGLTTDPTPDIPTDTAMDPTPDTTSGPDPDTTSGPTPNTTGPTDGVTGPTTEPSTEPTGSSADPADDPASDPTGDAANDFAEPSATSRSTDSSAQAAASAPDSEQTQRTLPRTGGAPWPLASMGLLLVLAGVVLRRLGTGRGGSNGA